MEEDQRDLERAPRLPHVAFPAMLAAPACRCRFQKSAVHDQAHDWSW